MQVTPGDGALTVTWDVAPRAGVDDHEIKHALRWSQESGVWANPDPDPDTLTLSKNDGIAVDGGVTSYTIDGLQNGVATGVFVRSFVGGDASESAKGSSLWVRVKGDRTTPGPVPQQLTPPDQQPQQQQQGPATPSNVVVSQNPVIQTGLAVTWDRVTGALAYHAEWRIAGTTVLFGSNYGISASRGTQSRQFGITGLTLGTEYEVRIRAVGGSANGGWSDWVKGTPGAPATTTQQPTTPTPTTSAKALWTSTLTVDYYAVGNFYGCDDLGSMDNCSAAMTANSFTYKGASYTVRRLFTLSATRLFVQISPAPPADLRAEGVLFIGGTAHPLSSAGTWAAGGTEAQLPVSNLGWSDGQTVSLRLIGPPEPPGAPANLSPAPGNGRLRVFWSAPADDGGAAVTGYDVRYRASVGSSWRDAGHTGTARAATITGLTNGKRYDVQVRARNAKGIGPWSETAQATLTLRLPGAPRVLSFTTGGEDTDAVIAWAPRPLSEEVTGYDVQFKGEGDPVWTSLQARYTHNNTANINSTRISDGARYDVRVRAVNAAGEGPWSATFTGAAVAREVSAPVAPRRFTVAAGNGQITASWNGYSTPIDGYEVEYTQSTLTNGFPPGGEGPSHGVARLLLGVDDNPVFITGLTNYIRYSVRARAWNDAGNGPWTEWHAATPTDPAAGFKWGPNLSAPNQGRHTGCDNSTANKCTTLLADNWFNYYDQRYTVQELSLRDGVLTLRLDKDVPPGLRAGGYLQFHVYRDGFPNPAMAVVELPGDFDADPKFMKWTGIDGHWNGRHHFSLYAYPQRDPQVTLSATRTVVAEGTETEVTVTLQPQEVAATVTVTVTVKGGACVCDDYTIREVGFDVLGDWAVMNLKFSASTDAESLSFIVGANVDAESEAEETLVVDAGIQATGGPETPDVYTPDFDRDQRDSLTLRIPQNMGKPIGVTQTRGSGKITATWSPPAGDGPSPTGYDVRYKETSASNWIDAGYTGAEGADAWTSTLTVADTGGGDKGCFQSDSLSSGGSSCTAKLSDNDFEFGGVTYQVLQVDRRNNGDLDFALNKDFSNELGSLTLHVGNTQFSFAGKPVKHASLLGRWVVSWSNAGLSWSVGDEVSLRLTPAPAHEITGLSDGTAYEVQVRAKNADLTGPWAESNRPPGAPTGGIIPDKGAKEYTEDETGNPWPATRGVAGTLFVAWSAPADKGIPAALTGYEVQYSHVNDNQYTNHAHYGTRTQTTISGLADGVYRVRVRAVNAAGPGPWSRRAVARIGPVPQLQPQGPDNSVWSATLNVKKLSVSQALITPDRYRGCLTSHADTAMKCSTAATLTDNDFTIGGVTYTIHEISWELDSNRFAFLVKAPTTPQTTMTVSPRLFDKYLLYVDGAPYEFRDVGRAPTWINQELGWETGGTVQLSLRPRPPDAPKPPVLDAGKTQITAVWSAPSGPRVNAQGQSIDPQGRLLADEGHSPVHLYDVEFAPAGGEWRYIGSTTETRWRITGRTPGAEYDVRVRAVSAAGRSPWSHAATVTTLQETPIALHTDRTTLTEGGPAATLTVTIPSSWTQNGRATLSASVGGFEDPVAKPGDDYAVHGFPNIFEQGETSKTFTIRAVADAEGEPAERFTVYVAGREVGASGASGRSESLYFTIAENPGMPAGLSATGSGAGAITATWSPPAGEGPSPTGYDVQYRRSSDTNWRNAGSVALGEVWSATLTARSLGITNGDRGCNNVATSGKCSDGVTLTDDDFVLGGMPYSFKGIYYLPELNFSGSIVPEQITIDLDQAVTPQIRNSIMVIDGQWFDLSAARHVPADFPNRLEIRANPPVWTTNQVVQLRLLRGGSHEITGLTDGTQYDVRVRATHAGGAGPWSSPASATPGGGAQSSPGEPQQGDSQQQQQGGPPEPGQLEPYNVQVTPGDGTLTVTWSVAPRDGFADDDIRHALRWSQVSGVWANPDPDPDTLTLSKNDGITVEGGVTSYTITGLANDVATGVFVRSFVGSNLSERSEHSSQWVRTKGDHTTPTAGQPQQPQEPATPKTFSVSAAASAPEGGSATLAVTLSEAAPAGGVELTVTAGYGGSAEQSDVGNVPQTVAVAAGEQTATLPIPTAADAVDEDDETFTVTLAASTQGWESASGGQDAATVTILDDDTAGVTVTPTSLGIAEDGSASYSVVLDSQPTDDVFVLPGSNDDGATYDALPLVFSPENWDTPQTVSVSGVADDDRDDESMTITHEASSGDPKYHRVPVSSVSVTVTDTTPPPAQQQQQQQQQSPAESEPPTPGQLEPYNIRITPGDGTLTVTWSVAPRAGVDDADIRHALRWSQVSGVWANPEDPNAGGREDGISVAGGVYSYTVTGLKNGVATGVFVRSFTGTDHSERASESSKWVRIKGDNTTPRAD